jgi:hypothetical protein
MGALPANKCSAAIGDGRRNVLLGEIVSLNCVTGFPMDNEVELLDPIVDPVKLLVHCFGPALLDSVASIDVGTIFVGLGCGQWSNLGQDL